MTVLFTARQTATAALTSVTSTVNVVTHAATALADLATVGSLHAAHYRKTTEAALALEADELEELAIDAAAVRIARRQTELVRELSQDSDLADKFLTIQARLQAKRRPSIKVAAE